MNEANSGSLMRMVHGPYSVAFPGTVVWSWFGSETVELEPVLMWDASVSGNS